MGSGENSSVLLLSDAPVALRNHGEGPRCAGQREERPVPSGSITCAHQWAVEGLESGNILGFSAAAVAEVSFKKYVSCFIQPQG